MVQSTDVASGRGTQTKKFASEEEKQKNKTQRAKDNKAASLAKLAATPVSKQPTKQRTKAFIEASKQIAAKISGVQHTDYHHLDQCLDFATRAKEELRKYLQSLTKCRKANSIKMPKKLADKFLKQLRVNATGLHRNVNSIVNSSQYAQDAYPHNKTEECSLETIIFKEIMCLYSMYKENLMVDLKRKIIGIPTPRVILHGQGHRNEDERGRSVDFGEFIIYFIWSNDSWVSAGPKVINEGLFSTAPYPHPHINGFDSGLGYGKLCAGEAQLAIQTAIKKGRIADALQNAEAVVNMYNEASPYSRLANFFKVADAKGRYKGPPLPQPPRAVACPSCNNQVMDNTLSAEACACGTRNCANCYRSCQGKHPGRSRALQLCPRCSWQCSCGIHYCHDDAHKSVTCSHADCSRRQCSGESCTFKTTCCQSVVCAAHVYYCYGCRKVVCAKHIRNGYCEVCITKDYCPSCKKTSNKIIACVCGNSKFCDNCVSSCDCCQSYICTDCSLACADCGEITCTNCVNHESGRCINCEPRSVIVEVVNAISNVTLSEEEADGEARPEESPPEAATGNQNHAAVSAGTGAVSANRPAAAQAALEDEEFIALDEPTAGNHMFWSAEEGANNSIAARRSRWSQFRSERNV